MHPVLYYAVFSPPNLSSTAQCLKPEPESHSRLSSILSSSVPVIFQLLNSSQVFSSSTFAPGDPLPFAILSFSASFLPCKWSFSSGVTPSQWLHITYRPGWDFASASVSKACFWPPGTQYTNPAYPNFSDFCGLAQSQLGSRMDSGETLVSTVLTANITKNPVNIWRRGSCLPERAGVLLNSQPLALSWRLSICSLPFWALIVGIDAAAIISCLLQPPQIRGISVAKCHFHGPLCIVCNYNWFTTFFVRQADAFSTPPKESRRTFLLTLQESSFPYF